MPVKYPPPIGIGIAEVILSHQWQILIPFHAGESLVKSNCAKKNKTGEAKTYRYQDKKTRPLAGGLAGADSAQVTGSHAPY